MFVNLEARKNINNNVSTEREKISDFKNSSEDKNLTIKIPVFQYSE